MEERKHRLCNPKCDEAVTGVPGDPTDVGGGQGMRAASHAELDSIRSRWADFTLLTRVPHHAIWSVGTACNLQCRYCYESLPNTEREPAVADVGKALAELLFRQWQFRSQLGIDRSPPSIHFFGGEPLLWFDEIVKTVEHGRSLHPAFGFGITTNLTLMDREKAEWMASRGFSFLCSIDGPEDVHDAFRVDKSGQGSWSRAMSGWVLLKALSDRTEVRGTLMPQFADRVDEILLFLEGLGGTGFVAYPAFEVEWDEEALRAAEDGLMRYAAHWIERFRRKRPPNSGNIRRCLQVFFGSGLERGGPPCGRGDRVLGVRPDGGLVPCHRLTACRGLPPAWHFGSVFSGIDLMRFRESISWDPKKLRPQANYDCNMCPARSTCNGHCIAANYQVTGSRYVVLKAICDFELIYYRVGAMIAGIIRDPALRRWVQGGRGAC